MQFMACHRPRQPLKHDIYFFYRLTQPSRYSTLGGTRVVLDHMIVFTEQSSKYTSAKYQNKMKCLDGYSGLC